jgi:hypothetical protein
MKFGTANLSEKLLNLIHYHPKFYNISVLQFEPRFISLFILNVLLTVHRNISVLQDQQDELLAFSLLLLIASICFEHLFAHHQEVLYIQQFVYFVRIMLAACYTQNIPIVVYTVPPDDEQISARNM